MTEMDWLEIFSLNLRVLLTEARMTQRELADAAYLSEAAVSNYIHQRKIPSLKAIINISKALDIDVGELIDFGDMVI